MGVLFIEGIKLVNYIKVSKLKIPITVVDTVP